MPPETTQPNLPVTSRTPSRRILFIIGAIILLVSMLAVVAWINRDFFVKDTQSITSFLVSDGPDNRSGYLFSKGVLTPVVDAAEPIAPIFSVEGWPVTTIEAREDGMYACSAEECAQLFSFGRAVEEPVAFAVAGDMLVMVHPLTRELYGFHLVPALPARVEPLFFIKNEVMPNVEGIAQDPSREHGFVFAESEEGSEGNVLRVCDVQLSDDFTTLISGDCATQVLDVPFSVPFVAPLP